MSKAACCAHDYCVLCVGSTNKSFSKWLHNLIAILNANWTHPIDMWLNSKRNVNNDRNYNVTRAAHIHSIYVTKSWILRWEREIKKYQANTSLLLFSAAGADRIFCCFFGERFHRWMCFDRLYAYISLFNKYYYSFFLVFISSYTLNLCF